MFLNKPRESSSVSRNNDIMLCMVTNIRGLHLAEIPLLQRLCKDDKKRSMNYFILKFLFRSLLNTKKTTVISVYIENKYV